MSRLLELDPPAAPAKAMAALREAIAAAEAAGEKDAFAAAADEAEMDDDERAAAAGAAPMPFVVPCPTSTTELVRLLVRYGRAPRRCRELLRRVRACHSTKVSKANAPTLLYSTLLYSTLLYSTLLY